MKLASYLLFGFAMAIGLGLFVALLRNVGIDIDALAALVKSLRPLPVTAILMAVLGSVWLGGEKWRLVEAQLSGAAPSRKAAVSLAAIGAACGQVLPPPLASAIVRGAGNRLRGGRAGRGVVASIWEQGFDLAILVALCPASILWMIRQDTLQFMAASLFTILVLFALVAPGCRLVSSLVPALSDVAEARLCMKLLALSVSRYVLLLIITVGVAQAISASIPPSSLAAAVPLVGSASILSFAPAGLGVNEWSFVYVLAHAGASAKAGATFAIANRLLVGGISISTGLVAACVAMASGTCRSRSEWGLGGARDDPNRDRATG